jgi:hypothetical protein
VSDSSGGVTNCTLLSQFGAPALTVVAVSGSNSDACTLSSSGLTSGFVAVATSTTINDPAYVTAQSTGSFTVTVPALSNGNTADVNFMVVLP